VSEAEALEREIAAFVSRQTGGRVARIARAATGASRGTWLVDVVVADGSERALVVRRDTGDGPLSGTELDLAREARVYRALRDTPVRIPRLVAASADGTMLLVERAPGSDAFAAIAERGAREAVARDYMRALAELHAVDVAALDLPGFPIPREVRDHARLDLALWRRIFERHARGEDRLVARAFATLDALAPPGAERTALCHGDAGPGNFLYEGERVTALLDWEFAHAGDPLDDLAWVAVRAHLLGGFGDLAGGFRVWAAASGLDVVPARIEYYRALVLVRMAVSCLAALGRAGERAMDTSVYALLLPYLRWLIPQALARSGARDPVLDGFEKAARQKLELSPVLAAHARPLAPIDGG
jgi:aminoglycoside phosphotransferase (APT) family kinase protein